MFVSPSAKKPEAEKELDGLQHKQNMAACLIRRSDRFARQYPARSRGERRVRSCHVLPSCVLLQSCLHQIGNEQLIQLKLAFRDALLERIAAQRFQRSAIASNAVAQRSLALSCCAGLTNTFF